MIEFYDTRSYALGDGVITQIPFDFLITKKADILFTIVESGQTPIKFDGNDTTYLSSLTFDAVGGGGTATLLVALASGKTIYLDLNVVEPVQSSLFRDRSNYSLRTFETALDYVVTGVQTLFRNVERSFRFARHVDISVFDPTLPDGLVGAVSKTIMTNTSGNGLVVGPSATDIANAQANADYVAQATAAIQNDTFFKIVDTSDNTKKVVFDVQGTTGTATTIQTNQASNQIVNIPSTAGVTDTFALLALEQSLSNKTLLTSCSFANTADPTKKIVFSLGGMTTATQTFFIVSHTLARAITFPDNTGTVALTNITQTFTGAQTFQNLSVTTNPLNLTVGQLKFPSTPNPSSDVNTMDDYKEGTWTPACTSSAGVVTTFTTSGSVTKWGNRVTVDFDITVTTLGTGSGILQISNFPYTSAVRASGCCKEVNVTAASQTVDLAAGGTNATVIGFNNTNNIAANARFIGSITYRV